MNARMIGAVGLALLTCAGIAVAQTYEVKVESTLNGLDVKIEPVPSDGLLIVKLTNASPGKVRCDLRFDASPQPIGRKTVYVDAGATEQAPFRAKRKWFEVDVAVECKPDQK